MRSAAVFGFVLVTQTGSRDGCAHVRPTHNKITSTGAHAAAAHSTKCGCPTSYALQIPPCALPMLARCSYVSRVAIIDAAKPTGIVFLALLSAIGDAGEAVVARARPGEALPRP